MVSARPFFSGSPGLGAVERLHLALLVAAQHQRVLGRRHVQAHDVFQFLDKGRITRHLEAPHEMGLQTLGPPMPRDGGGAHAQFCGHLARAPVRGRLGLALRGQLHQPRHVDLQRRRPARQVAHDARQPRLRIAPPPTGDLHATDSHLLRDVPVLHTAGRQQHHPRPLRQPDAGEFGTNQTRQLRTLVIGQHNLRRDSHWNLHCACSAHWT
jgi:hypothetical protein